MLKDHPPPTTGPELLGILEEPIKREPIFHRQEFETTRADFALAAHLFLDPRIKPHTKRSGKSP